MSGFGLCLPPQLLESNPAPCLRDFQARGKSRLFDFSTERLFNSCQRRGSFRDGFSLAGVTTQPLRSVSNAQRSVEVLMDRDRASSQRAAPVHFFDLQGQVLEADRVIPVHRTLELSEKIRSRSRRRQATKALPAWAAGT